MGEKDWNIKTEKSREYICLEKKNRNNNKHIIQERKKYKERKKERKKERNRDR